MTAPTPTKKLTGPIVKDGGSRRGTLGRALSDGNQRKNQSKRMAMPEAVSPGRAEAGRRQQLEPCLSTSMNI